MSNPFTGVVSSALRKCQLLLELAPDKEEPSPLALQQVALLEGAAVHLWRAYRAFLAEQAYQLQLGVEPKTALELYRAASGAEKVSAEVSELLALEEDRGSWLAGLHLTWNQLWRFSADSRGQASTRAGEGSAVNLIPVQNMPEVGSQALSSSLLRDWQSRLAELIYRQRTQSAEW